MKKMILTLLALTCLAAQARATDFNVAIVNLDGTATTGPDGKSVELKLRKVVIDALLAVFPDEQNLAGDDKITRWILAKNIQENSSYSLDAKETELIKKLVAKMYGPLVVGQVWSIVDPASIKEKK